MVASCSGGGSVGRVGASVRGITFSKTQHTVCFIQQFIVHRSNHLLLQTFCFCTDCFKALADSVYLCQRTNSVKPTLHFSTCVNNPADFTGNIHGSWIGGPTPHRVLPRSWLKQCIILSVRGFRRFFCVILDQFTLNSN